MKTRKCLPILALLIVLIVGACAEPSTSESISCHGVAYTPAFVEADIFYNYAIKQNIQITIIAPDGNEAWMGNQRWGSAESLDDSAALPVGFRKQAADGSLSWGWKHTLYFSPLLPGTNIYKFVLLDANTKQELEQKSIVVTSTTGRCGEPHVELSEPIEFTLISAPRDPIDTSKEYIPLEDGSVIALDPNTGIGNLVGGSKAWTDIEILRFIVVQTVVHGGVSVDRFEERAVVDKTRIGQFIEFDVDRGPLPENLDNVPDDRWKSAEMNELKITDTKSRVIYGKPKL